MSEPIVLRFTEHERYDIFLDATVIVYMATGNYGSYYAEVVDDGWKSRRENRQKFKEIAVFMYRNGEPPCQIDLTAEYPTSTTSRGAYSNSDLPSIVATGIPAA